MAEPIASGADSQRRVEPSMSVNRNVTVPDGVPTGDDPSTAATGTARYRPDRALCRPYADRSQLPVRSSGSPVSVLGAALGIGGPACGVLVWRRGRAIPTPGRLLFFGG